MSIPIPVKLMAAPIIIIRQLCPSPMANTAPPIIISIIPKAIIIQKIYLYCLYIGICTKRARSNLLALKKCKKSYPINDSNVCDSLLSGLHTTVNHRSKQNGYGRCLHDGAHRIAAMSHSK